MNRAIGHLTRGGLFSALFALTMAQAEERDNVYGLWSGGDSIVDVQPTGEGGLSMSIVALRDATYRADESRGEPGALRRDDNNPQEALRERALIGLELLSGYTYTGSRWEGRVYDPESGNTYKSRMEREGDRLRMRGYIGVPMLGRTRYFEPVEACDEAVRAMLAGSGSGTGLVMCD